MADIADLPAWIAEALSAERQAPARAAVAELDLPVNIDRARERLRFLVSAGDVAIEGAGGDDRTYRLCAEMLNLGLSTTQATCEILEIWNPHCVPPWTDDEIAEKVGNASRYAQNEPGSYAAGDNTEALAATALAYAAEHAPAPPEPLAGFKRWAEVRDAEFARPSWVWANRCLFANHNLYTGRPKAGKTTLCENLAAAVCGGADFLGAATRQMPVVMLAAEDGYGPLRDNIREAAQALGVEAEQLDRNLWLRSVLDEPVPGGHALARIGDDGSVADTRLMREVVVPLLREIGGPVLWIVDPLVSFVRFNRYSDEAAGALSRDWLTEVCRLNNRQITALITDHPSQASTREGRHVGGSVQMEAGFAVSATLKAGEWRGVGLKQRQMEFVTLGVRYGAEETVRFYRTAGSAAFTKEGAPGHTARDNMERVYRHVAERLNAGKFTGKSNSSEYGPAEVAEYLAMDETDAKRALAQLAAGQWLVYESSKGGSQGHAPAHYALGPMAPKLSSLAPAPADPW